jgi:uncharacterized phage protein (TIGR02218 family)
VTALCTCWKIARLDSVAEGYTDHDRTLVIDGVTYRPASGFAPSAVERSIELRADNQQIVGVIDSDWLSESDLRSGVYTGARVTTFLVDWSTSTAVYTLLVGHLGRVSITDGQYSVELVSLEQELSKPLGRTAQVRCDADLGDTRCGVSVSATAGVVSAVIVSRRVIEDTARVEADGHFNGGRVTWTMGANKGRSMDVKRYVASTQTIELSEPMPSDIILGDTYEITPGCDKTFETCRDVFLNHERFRGLPYLPGTTNLAGNNLDD